jgi:glycine cleavage system regulatory protein
MPPTHRQEIEAILAGARAERAALLERVSPALRASLPVDATGITQAIEHLAELAGLSEELRRAQARAHQANPAVLHGRVFGRAPLSPETVTAAFVEGARVRAGLLARVAAALGGQDLEDEVAALLAERPPDPDATGRTSAPVLRAAYAAQEDAALRIAEHVDST